VRGRAVARLHRSGAEQPGPLGGRAEDRTDAGVWAVTCFVTRAGFRERGASRALARAAVGHARERGARALEGYPITTTGVTSDPAGRPLTVLPLSRSDT